MGPAQPELLCGNVKVLIGKIVSGGQTGVDRVSTEAEPSCRRQAWCALEAAFVTRLIETVKNGNDQVEAGNFV